MITFVITLDDSSQFEISGMSWTTVAFEVGIIRHRDYNSIPIRSIVRL